MCEICDKVVENIHKMIRSHEIQTGKKPKSIQYPQRKMVIDGIDINFSKVEAMYSIGDGKIIHHDFVTHNTYVERI